MNHMTDLPSHSSCSVRTGRGVVQQSSSPWEGGKWSPPCHHHSMLRASAIADQKSSILSPGCLTGSGMSNGCRGELETHREDSSRQEQEAWVFYLVTSSVTWVPGRAPLPGLHLFCLCGEGGSEPVPFV